jgi:hypothetical protein
MMRTARVHELEDELSALLFGEPAEQPADQEQVA